MVLRAGELQELERGELQVLERGVLQEEEEEVGIEQGEESAVAALAGSRQEEVVILAVAMAETLQGVEMSVAVAPVEWKEEELAAAMRKGSE